MKSYFLLPLIAAGLSVSAAGMAAGNNAPNPQADSQAVFNQLDNNGDDKLTAAEMSTLPDVMKQQWLDRIDTNQDGKIQNSEFEARAVAKAKARADHMFAKMDTNGDGAISADEMRPPMGHHRKGPPKGHMPSHPPASDHGDAPKPPRQGDMGGHSDDRDHHRCGHHEGHHRHHGKPGTSDAFAHMDTNNDGYVSADEWHQAAQQWQRHHGPHKPQPRQDRND